MQITALEQFNTRMPREIWRWRDALITEHAPIMSDLIATYARDCRDRGGYVRANHHLRELSEALTVPVYTPLGLSLDAQASATMDDEEVKALAEQAAEFCSDLEAESGGDVWELAGAVMRHCGAHRVEFAFPWDNVPRSWPPEKIREELLGAIARACDAQWWRRQLRERNGRQVEQILRGLGRVQKRAQPYVSDWAFERWKTAQHRNRAVMESMEAVNEVGEVVSLADAVAGSVSNPVNRRNELMVRMRGFEEIAREMELTGLFLTLTAPSAYHARLHHGPLNPKYNGATPDTVQRYLSKVWSKIRARWAKAGIKAFGFRVAEPHHDGTPHWHMLLFFSPPDAGLAWEIFRAEALREDGDEDGAQEHRAQREIMDPERSATGYIAKYISKNIDAHGVELDEEGECLASEGAGRARAWASMWGIKQFQQIGAVSVTVWRELRRRREPLEEWEPEGAEEIRAACDKGDWRRFVELMGGPTVAREEMTLRPFHFEGGKSSRYGDEIRRLLGVVMRNVSRYINTRQHVWTIRRGAGEVRQLPRATKEDIARLLPGLTFDQKPLEERMEIQISRALAREQKGPAQPGRLDLCQ